jgi:hypothetical protein
MSENKKRKKQHSRFIDTMSRIAGRSLQKAVKDTFFRKRLMNDHQYKYAVSIEDNPIAEFMITKLERERALIDMQEYQAMIDGVHEAVKQEAIKATEEGLRDCLETISI